MQISPATDRRGLRSRVLSVVILLGFVLTSPVLASLVLTSLVLTGVCQAATSDPFDLASINLLPNYMSPANYRPAATLHAVATSPDSQNPISITVGDGGTILRSTDGGRTWNPMERMTALSEQPPETRPQPFGAKRPKIRYTSIPFWHFYDVAWLSPVDVVIVGGAFEPVTRVSRGVVLVSEDAGETWAMGNAHELPRLQRLVRHPDRPLGTVEAIGDASEASGVNRFFSHDAGRTWVEDNLAATANPIDSPSSMNSARENALIRVGEYGHIAINQNGQWRTVRGQGRHAAVAMIVASPQSTAWSLAGRESLHENNRVVMAFCGKNSLASSSFAPVADAAKLLGITVCDQLAKFDSAKVDSAKVELAEAHRWLQRHRPSVVVLDESLRDRDYQTWMTAIERTRQSSGDVYPKRILATRTPADSQSIAVRNPSIWKRSSILRSDALLTGPATLAGDFASDALMIAAPGCPTAPTVEVTTVDDLSGNIRRDISLAAGLPLVEGQTRRDDEVYIAANRRLQIASARISQIRNLQNQLAASIQRPTPRDATVIATTIQNALEVTASEDRTRLLWDQLTQAMYLRNSSVPIDRPGFETVRRVLLEQLERSATPAALRRWATWTRQTLHQSREHAARPSRTSLTRKWSGHYEQGSKVQPVSASEVVQRGQLQDTAPENAAGSRSASLPGSRVLSPFQITPASYESYGSNSLSTVAPTAILIPQTKPTVWQTTRGIRGIRPNPPLPVVAANDNESETTTQRINWDYHPVIMAGRQVDPLSQPSGGPIATRPILDGELNDVCWRDSLSFPSGFHTTRWTQDDEYDFFAITASNDSSLTLRLDCDGDYLTTINLKLDRDGNRSAAVDDLESFSPRWYAAGKATNTAIWSTEIAIRKSDLPGSIQRVKVEKTAPREPTVWQAMPEPNEWFERSP